MARRNNKIAKGAKSATGANGDALPKFDDNALSALTAKIEKGFGAGESAKASPNSKRKKDTKRIEKSSSTEDKSTPRSSAIPRGTKRDASGNAKVEGKSKPAKQPKETGGKTTREILLAEILALGGTEEDLDLVADAVSDDEDGSADTTSADKNLQKELARFVAGLGIDGQAAGDEPEDEDVLEEGAQTEERDGWEDASEGDSESSEDTAEAVPERKQAVPVSQTASANNDPNRLVSYSTTIVIGLTDS